MNKRRIPLTNDEPKHKKKSSAKGQPRADHKHQYETVLLHIRCNFDGKISEYFTPTKVCVICGRINKPDTNKSYFVNDDNHSLFPWFTKSRELSDKALSLPKWAVDDYFDKFAHQEGENNEQQG